jgi:hypothetical protein
MPMTQLSDLAAEVVVLWRAPADEAAHHATDREDAYRQVDPRRLARSLPGVGELGGPAPRSWWGIAVWGSGRSFAWARRWHFGQRTSPGTCTTINATSGPQRSSRGTHTTLRQRREDLTRVNEDEGAS